MSGNRSTNLAQNKFTSRRWASNSDIFKLRTCRRVAGLLARMFPRAAQQVGSEGSQKTFGEYGSTCVQDLASERFCVFAKDVPEIGPEDVYKMCVRERSDIELVG